jgi:hypothetical protein
MNREGLFNKSPASIKVALTVTIAVWTAVFVILIAGLVFLLERPGHALGSTPGASIPQVILEPDAGPPGTEVIVRGQGWTPGSSILIFLVAPGQSQPASYATSSAIADAQGRFSAGFTVPSDPGWQGPGQATVMVRDSEHGVSGRATFNVTRSPVQPTPTPTARSEPTATATLVPTWTPSPTPTPTPQPRIPTAVTTADLHVRSGPGTVYPVLGALGKGQSATVTGVSTDRSWWQIQFSGAPDGHGWISTYYVTAQDTQDVPVVQAPPPPPTPTPTPTPIPTSTPTPPPQPLIITDWLGEYFANRKLSGDPVLVRNDPAIDFDWGTGSPGPGVPSDDFSARWTRTLDFKDGTYRFQIRVDDGVRLWVDNTLVIDSWHDGSSHLIQKKHHISEGRHRIKIEYYEHKGGALIDVKWKRL